MLRPARMLHLNVLVLDSDVDCATTEMIRSGLVHMVRVTDLEPWAEEDGLQTVSEEDSQALEQIENMVRSIAEKLGIRGEIVSEALAFEAFDVEIARTKLEEINREVNSVVAARAAAGQQLTALKQTRTQLPRDVWAKFGIDMRSRYTLLEFVLGRLPERSLDALKRMLSGVPNVVLTFPEEKGRVAVTVIVLKRDRDTLRRATEEVGLEEIHIPEKEAPPSEEMLTHLEARLKEVEKAIQQADAALEQSRGRYLPELRAILSPLVLQKLKRRARTTFRRTARTYLISGWTPRNSREKVVEAIKKACRNRCLIEEHSADEILSERRQEADVPILFENPRVLKPFEMLVANYGCPTYNSIEPTVVVAPTFLLMFGVMFGDVGQGLVMAILGALVAHWKRVSEGVRRIGELFVWCGMAATLFGLVYGTVFGFANLLPWENEPLRNVSTFLRLAIFFGIGIISLGLAFNIIAAIRTKEWAAGLLDWTGLMGLAFYWLAVTTVIQLFSGGRASHTVIGALIALPVLSALLRVPIERLTRPATQPPEEGVAASTARAFGHMFAGFFESILGLFTNTLSFLRVAAFAIAHGALFAAVFSIAATFGSGGFPILAHVLGNAGIIALEGLVVCVQALRLEYYEFFGKFFRAGGPAFTPLKLPTAAR